MHFMLYNHLLILVVDEIYINIALRKYKNPLHFLMIFYFNYIIF
jgi:hypothetical protein